MAREKTWERMRDFPIGDKLDENITQNDGSWIVGDWKKKGNRRSILEVALNWPEYIKNHSKNVLPTVPISC